MHRVDIKEAHERFPQLIEEAAAGEDVVITQDRRPLVRLVGMERPPRKRIPGSAKGLIKLAADFDAPLEDFREYT